MINIYPVAYNKKRYLDLLLLADNNEDKASCVVTEEGKGIYEIKNIAVYPQFRRQGYGKKLISFILDQYKARCHTMLVGTGDNISAVVIRKPVSK